jgi:hypothetical protein
VPKDAWNLRFESVGMRIPASLVANSPTLLVVAVEDVCWQVARDDWRAGEPSRWHRRAHAAWQEQYQQLEAKRDRLRDLVEEALVAS